jgi:hypothetical protein
MVKRSNKNVDKVVKIINYQRVWDGRLGVVAGFRGDFEKGDPYVYVYLFSTMSVWPIPGHNLEIVDISIKEARKQRTE